MTVSRTYGRVTDVYGHKTWVEVLPTKSGALDYTYLTTLAQVCKLIPGESPFFANYGIPVNQSLITQIAPDYFVQRTQQQFAGYFAALALYKQPSFEPTYQLNVMTQEGIILDYTIPIPQ